MLLHSEQLRHEGFVLKAGHGRMSGGIKINEALQRQQENLRLRLQLNKRAPGSRGKHITVQVPSTSRNQLHDRYNDMIRSRVETVCGVALLRRVVQNSGRKYGVSRKSTGPSVLLTALKSPVPFP